MASRMVWSVVCVGLLSCKGDKQPAPGSGSAVGAGSAGSAAPTAKTACSLLSAAEVAAVVGNAVKDGVDEGIRDCKYDAVDPPDWDPSKPIPAIFSAHLFYAH
ncbi:MAG TPA: hypothetical protein VIV40_35935, partial [Kofleriaceae bacterium]